MRQILAIDRAAAVVRCQAGATVESVQIAAAEAGLFYPIDFAAKGSAHIGGSIATNAGGVRVLRYGTTRSWVAGLSVVLASGEVLNVGGPLLKDNTGYDLRHLFIGSEGTLGVIVEATLRLCAPPNEAVVACCGVEDLDDIIALLQRLRSSFALQAFECFDAGCLSYVHRHHGKGRSAGPFEAPYYALVEVEVPGHGDPQREFESLADELVAAEQAGEIVEATIATSAAQARELWALREDISEALHRHRPHKSDVSIPIGSIPAFVAAWRALVMAAISGAEPLVFGHIGDSNLHLNVVPAPQTATDVFVAAARSLDEATYVLVGRYEGSISAEHGIGLLKRDYLHHSRSANELAIMKAIKHQLDPDGLFNPGKLLGA
jgi:FAD/FMN-containing dehydrogenase